MRKILLVGVILASLVCGLGALNFGSYKQIYGDRNWHTKLNNFIDAVGTQVQSELDQLTANLQALEDTLTASISNLATLVTNWAVTENYVVYLPVTPSYTDGDTFTIPGDYSSQLINGIKIQAYCGTDGMKYGTVASSSYAGGTTTVELAASVLTANLTNVYYVAERDGLVPRGTNAVYALDYGTPSQATLESALAAIAASNRTLVVGPGTWSITDDLTIPLNVNVAPQKGAVFDVATTKTLTVNGQITAGPYQIFSWTGTGKVVLAASNEALTEWWGAVADNSTDSQPAIQAALNALTNGGTVRLLTGIYKMTSYNDLGSSVYYSLVWPDVNNLTLTGVRGGTILRGKDHASTNYHMLMISASGAGGITSPTVSGITFTGEADQAAVPAHGIVIGDYIYNLLISDCEIKWIRGTGIRHSSANPGERHTIQRCYIHDLGTTNMTIASAGGNGIYGNAPKTDVLFCRIINCGIGDPAGLAHSIYAVNADGRYDGNYIEGRGFDIRSGTYTGTHLIVVNNRIKSTDATDTQHTLYSYQHSLVANNIFEDGWVMLIGGNLHFIGNVIDAAGLTLPDTSTGYLTIRGSKIIAANNNIYGKGIVDYSTGIAVGGAPTLGLSNEEIIISANNIQDCSIALKLIANTAIAGVSFTGNRCNGGANNTTTWIGVYAPASSTVTGDFKVTNNDFNNYYTAFNVGEDIGPALYMGNALKGCTVMATVTPDPCDDILFVANVALDSTLASPYNVTYPPSATRVFRVVDFQRLSDAGVVTLANSATPAVWMGNTFKTGGTTTITNLTGGSVGDTKYILGAHSVTIDSEANTNDGYIKLSTGDYSMTAGKVLVLHMFEQGCWQGLGN